MPVTRASRLRPASITPAPTSSAQHSQRAAHVYLGCSGWAYPSWKPGFYPPKVPAKQFLAYYASRLNSVEVNYTFQKLPTPETVRNWFKSVQESQFLFSFKAPQAITHFKRLRDCADVVELFYQSIEPIEQANRMGVVLYQLPPNFKADRERLALFLKKATQKRRVAFEFRHESWFTEEIFSTMRDFNVALCIATSDDLATPDIRTADFSCYRLRESKYSVARLRQIAEQFNIQTQTGDVFAYFKHEEKPAGPRRAVKVLKMVDQS